MLSIERYELKSINENCDFNKRWWVFQHRNNPKYVEIVFQYSNGNITGNKILVQNLKDFGYLNDEYKPSKEFLKKYADMIIRVQTNNKMGSSKY